MRVQSLGFEDFAETAKAQEEAVSPAEFEEAVAAARQAALEEGRAEGYASGHAAAMETIEADRAAALAELTRQITEHTEAWNDFSAAAAQDVAYCAGAFLRAFVGQHRDEAFKRRFVEAMQSAVRNAVGQPKLFVRFNKINADAVIEDARAVLREADFPGEIVFQPDDEFTEQQVRISWGLGKAVVDFDAIVSEMEGIFPSDKV